MVVRALALWHSDHCRGVHTNMLICRPPHPLRAPFKLFKMIGALLGNYVGLETFYSKRHVDALLKTEKDYIAEGGYRIQQSTFPQVRACLIFLWSIIQ